MTNLEGDYIDSVMLKINYIWSNYIYILKSNIISFIYYKKRINIIVLNFISNIHIMYYMIKIFYIEY